MHLFVCYFLPNELIICLTFRYQIWHDNASLWRKIVSGSRDTESSLGSLRNLSCPI